MPARDQSDCQAPGAPSDSRTPEHSGHDLTAAFDDSGPLPSGVEKQRMVRAMFDQIASRYELVNTIMTFGFDRRWRRSLVRSLGLEPGATVLDIGSGTGDVARELERRGYLAVAADISWGMLISSRHQAHRAGAADGPGRRMMQADAAELPVATGSVDAVASAFALRNLGDLAASLAEAARVLRPGGRIGLLEVSVPHNALLRAGHGVYFNRIVPTLGALLSDRSAYRYLPRSVAYLPPPRDLLRILETAGFEMPERRQMTGGVVQLFTARRSVDSNGGGPPQQ